MKISVVISIYNSHKAVDRYLKYLKKLNLPSDIEFIFADDGSNPPLNFKMKNLKICQTNNKLAWTQGLGRNLGASMAKGEYLLMTDIDHIISKNAFKTVYKYQGPMIRFTRKFGILDKNGNLKTDLNSLKKFGLVEKYWPGLTTNTHRNTFAIKKAVFEKIGGYKTWWCSWGYHPMTRRGDDCYFDSAWRKYADANGFETHPEIKSYVYVFPTGRFHKDLNPNPYDLFHNLGYQQQKYYKP